MRSALLLTLAIPAALAACTVGPNAQPPASLGEAPYAFRAAMPTSSVPDEPPPGWWRLYADAALDGYIADAFTANTDLRVATANLAQARAALDEARAARTPSLAITSGATYGINTTNLAAAGAHRGSLAPRVSYNFGGDVSYELDLYGRVRRLVEASRDDYAAQAGARDAVLVSIAGETARAYAAACAYAAAAVVAGRGLSVAQNSERLIRFQRRYGAVSDFEVARAAALTAQTRATIPSLDAQRRNALYRLAVLTGRTPETPMPAAERCGSAPRLASPVPVGDGIGLFRRRPDIREAERNLDAATARIGVQVADLYPQINLGAMFTTGASSFGGLFDAGNQIYGIGPALSWIFPNRSATRARIRQAQATAGAALARFDAAVLGALQDLETNLSTLNAELERNAALRETRDRDADALHIANIRYRDGSTSFLDLIDSQRQLITDENTLASSDQLVADDQIVVFKAVGGGWQLGPAPDLPVALYPREPHAPSPNRPKPGN